MTTKLKLARNLATAAKGANASIVARPTLLEDMPKADQDASPMFTISRDRGFLPRKDPLITLPSQFASFDALLSKMTIHQPDGSRGLLSYGHFAGAVEEEFKKNPIDKLVNEAIASGNQHLISALFRDFSFLVSAYLLEPVDIHFRETGKYCAGRDVLPSYIAKPMKALADALGHFPFMEYASSYALQNFRRVNTVNPDALNAIAEWETDNLRVIRAFEDADGSEAGFILVHVSMVAHTGRLVTETENVLAAAESQNRAAFTEALKNLLSAYQDINSTMETMWSWSRPVDYLKFRSFIFGTGPKKMNEMFPKGVVYEGVYNDEPVAFRGESGANDSIIPVADNLLQITRHLPKNELTETLREFRKYRPSSQRSYVEGLETRASDANVAEFARHDKASLAYYILMVDQVREFRDRHWRFTKNYIIKYSDYKIATGGSPILDYLPSNLSVVLRVMESALDDLGPTNEGLNEELAIKMDECREKAKTQLRILDREVKQLSEEARGFHDKRKWLRGHVGFDRVS